MANVLHEVHDKAESMGVTRDCWRSEMAATHLAQEACQVGFPWPLLMMPIRLPGMQAYVTW